MNIVNEMRMTIAANDRKLSAWNASGLRSLHVALMM